MVQSNRSLAESMRAAEKKLFNDYETVNQLAKSKDLTPLQERRAGELQNFRKKAAETLRQLAEYFDQLANSNAEPVNGFEAIRQNQNDEL